MKLQREPTSFTVETLLSISFLGQHAVIGTPRVVVLGRPGIYVKLMAHLVKNLIMSKFLAVYCEQAME